MAEDWLVRAGRQAEFEDVLAAAGNLGPDAELGGTEDRTFLVVRATGTPAVRVSLGRPLRDSEVARLHIAPGQDTGAGDWCLEVTGPAEAAAAVRAFAEHLARRLDGTPLRTSTDDRGLPGGLESAAADQVPADLLTPSCVVLRQSQHVVALTQTLVAAGAFARQRGRRLVVLTPDAATLTQAATGFLRNQQGAWVTELPHGYMDGHNGRSLTWTGRDFEPGAGTEPTFHGDVPLTPAIDVVAETMHAFDARTRIGDFSSAVFEAAGLRRPTSVGLLEPAAHPYDPGWMTPLARSASPDPVTFVAVAPDGDAVIEVQPQPIGVVERVRILARHEPGDPGRFAGFAEAALAAGALAGHVGRRIAIDGRLDPPRLTGPPLPVTQFFAKTRLVDLDDDRLLAFGGAGSRILTEPHAAFVVDYDQDPARGGEMINHQFLLTAVLLKHDAWALAAQQDAAS